MTASDTPETDAEYARIDGGQCLSGCCSLAHDPDCPVCFDFELMTRFARKLEADRGRLAAILVECLPIIRDIRGRAEPQHPELTERIQAAIAGVQAE